MKREKKTKTSAESARLPHHWRQVALENFPEHSETILSKDEEYAIYNLFFHLREQIADSIAAANFEVAVNILDFAGRCLQNELDSDGEDISVAAGVSLFEHIFEDSSAKDWPIIFRCMPLATYRACRHYAEQWMGSRAFSKVGEAAKKYYTSRKRTS